MSSVVEVAGAECRPNGNMVNWNSLLDGIVKAMIGLLSDENGAC